MDHLSLSLDRLPSEINRLYLAFSGGIDSVVLLHKLLNYRDRYSLILWHINHGLQQNALEMEQFAQSLAEQYELESHFDLLSLDPEMGNLEANARSQRYDLFAAKLSPSDALLTAHHMNDQAETLLLNLMRGSGSSGLSAIASQRPLGQGILFRPLLNVQRSEIEQYAQKHRLHWVEDPSNKSLKFNRNYIRHQVLPVLDQRWPSVIQQLHRASDWQTESKQLIHELAEIDFERVVVDSPFTIYNCLSIKTLNSLTEPRKKNLIRYWLKLHEKSVIGYKKMAELLKQFEARADAMPVIMTGDYSIRSYRHKLYIVDKLSEPDLDSVYEVTADNELNIPSIGLRETRGSIFRYLKLEDKGQSMALHFRQQDRVCQAASSVHKLKRLFHKHNIPPWKRSSTPQIFMDDDLVELRLF